MTVAAVSVYGHCRLDPALFTPPEHHKARPAVLTELQKRIKEYYFDPRRLPTLNAANGSARDQRSERREACLSLLGALVHYCDLETLRVGRPAGLGEFSGIDLATLAKRAGLGLRRAERASRDLVAAGIIKVHKICEQVADDKYIGLAAIRTLSKHLFAAFGLGTRLSAERRKAYARNNKRPPDETDKGRAGLAINSLQHRLNTPSDTTPKTPAEHLAALRAAVTCPPGR